MLVDTAHVSIDTQDKVIDINNIVDGGMLRLRSNVLAEDPKKAQ